MQADGVFCTSLNNVEEYNFVAVNPSLDIQLTLNGEADLNTQIEKELAHATTDEVQMEIMPDGIQEHVPLTNQLPMDGAGLSNSKPKTTWTWINKMDFGLDGFAREITIPTLRKKDMRDIVGEQIDEHETKRGKVINEDRFSKEIQVGVDSHPCRKL